MRASLYPSLVIARRESALSRRSLLKTKLALMALAGTGLAGCRPAPPTVRLYVESDGDFLSFKPNSLTVPTGAHVILTFHHSGRIISQEHDWVLARPNTMKALLAGIDKLAAAQPDASSVLPLDDPRIIAATKSIKKGQSTTMEFTAPAPGDYPFFCSTPGHGESMNGVLHVTPQ